MAKYSDFDSYWMHGKDDLLFETQKKARKIHYCTECSREISVGRSYRSSRFKIDGRWKTYKTCSSCIDIINWLLRCTNEETYAFGELYDELINSDLVSKVDEKEEASQCTWISNEPALVIERHYPLLIRVDK